MRAKEILSDKLFALKPSDRCSKAIELMNEWLVTNLPVVQQDKVLGYVSSEEIAFPDDDDDAVEQYLKNDKPCKVGREIHVLDLVGFFAEGGLGAIAVVDEEDKFTGIIDVKDLLKTIAEFFSFTSAGSVLSVEMASHDYSLSELSRLVESNDIKITGLLIRQAKGTENRIEVILKLNRSDIRSLLATLSRYNYQVTSESVNQEDLDFLKDRYNSFIKYLNI